MTATRLRLALVGLIILLVIGFGAGAWWVQGLLAESVRATDHAKIDAEVSATELQQLKALQKQLREEHDIVDRAKQIAASADQYRYQDQVIKDISDYAARYGIIVNTFDFGSTGTPTATSNRSSGSSSSSATQQPTATAKKTPFSVTLKGPLSYVTFLRLLQDIEKNLTKIQVTSLTLSPDRDPSRITNPALSLEVYLKP